MATLKSKNISKVPPSFQAERHIWATSTPKINETSKNSNSLSISIKSSELPTPSTRKCKIDVNNALFSNFNRDTSSDCSFGDESNGSTKENINPKEISISNESSDEKKNKNRSHEQSVIVVESSNDCEAFESRNFDEDEGSEELGPPNSHSNVEFQRKIEEFASVQSKNEDFLSVRPKTMKNGRRIWLDESSDTSAAGGDRSRSALYTKKEIVEKTTTKTTTSSFSVIREAKRTNRIDSDASDSEDPSEANIESESSNESAEESGPKIVDEDSERKIVQASDDDEEDVQFVETKKNDEIINLVSSFDDEGKVEDSRQDVGGADQQLSHLAIEIASVKERLDQLQAAMSKARFLPDGGERLKAKIKEVENELKSLKLRKENMSVLVAKPMFRIFPPPPTLQPQRQQYLYETNENKANKLYGGRMNDARKMEVRAVTHEAIEKLHGAIQACPMETEETADPKGLRIPLMVHQRQALTWLLWRENAVPPGGILADDMGLGKTLTMISLVLHQRQQFDDEDNFRGRKFLDKYGLIPSKATLVICPASLVHQWKGEIENRVKSGYINTLVYHGPKRDISAERMAEFDFVITSFSVVATEVGDDEEDVKKATKRKNKGSSALLKIGWERVILDEAHVIKNPRSLTCKACCRLPAGKRWVLTGTPIHNSLKDLYSLLKFLRCEPFDEWEVWKKWIDNKSERAADRLKTIIKGVLMRRTKEQLCPGTDRPLVTLPPKKIETHELELFASERKVYDRLFEASRKQVEEFVRLQEEKESQMVAVSSGRATASQFGCKDPFLTRNQKNTDEGKQMSQTMVLVLLLRLRQACTHLALMKEAINLDVFDDDVGSEEDLLEKLHNLSVIDKEQVVSLVPEVKTEDLFEKEYESTKIKVVLEKIKAILENSKGNVQKTVVVSQWAKLLDIVADHLRRGNISYTFINGQVKPEERNIRVDKFNTRNCSPVVMLLTLTAGGVGLNLVGGNHLFLLDMHWNPALEQQACDRIYRLGQSRDVFIHKFLCKKTIEEKVYALQNSKSSLAKNVMTGAGSMGRLTLNDLQFLFDLKK